MWNSFKQGFVGSLVNVLCASFTVYFFAWILNEPADDLVGWLALGLAVAPSKVKN
jgi:hypothetical protein